MEKSSPYHIHMLFFLPLALWVLHIYSTIGHDHGILEYLLVILYLGIPHIGKIISLNLRTKPVNTLLTHIYFVGANFAVFWFANFLQGAIDRDMHGDPWLPYLFLLAPVSIGGLTALAYLGIKLDSNK